MFVDWQAKLKFLGRKDPGPLVIRRLTKAFYAIRFGGERLDRAGRERLEATVAGLEPVLDAAVRGR